MVRFAQCRDDSIPAFVGGAEVDEQDLVVCVIDDLLQFGLTLKQVDLG